MADFPRAARLLGANDFKRVFERRTASRGAYFTLHQRPRRADAGPTGAEPAPDPGGPRLGIVVPKKLLKTAVHRNLVKRLVREAFRLHASRLPATDLVVRLARKLTPMQAGQQRRAIAQDVAVLFTRLRRPGVGTETAA